MGELHLDFDLTVAANLPNLLNRYVSFFNNHRSAAGFGYKSTRWIMIIEEDAVVLRNPSAF